MISRRFFVAALPLLIALARLDAQEMTGIPAVDSASVARAAYSRANRLLRDQRLEDARLEMDRAATAWPVQPAYVWASAVLAARARDTIALRARLNDYLAPGIGRDLRADTSISRTLPASEFEAFARRFDANRAPRANSAVRATLADSTFWPEGTDVDPVSGTLYVTSLRHGTIAEVKRDGSVREILPRRAPNVGAIFAVRHDALRGMLWATTSGVPQTAGYQPADSAIAALLGIRLSDGAIVKRVDLPIGQHVLGDVALSGRDVLFSDSRDPALYWLRAADDSLIRIVSPLMRSPQGIAPHPDGRSVYLADYSHGLLRVDLATRAVSWVGAAAGIVPIGLDGIVLHRGAIIAIQNGVAPARVVRFALDAAGTRIISATVLDQNSAIADEPTIGALNGDEFLYVANSQWEKHGDDGAPTPGAARTAPKILSLRLPR